MANHIQKYNLKDRGLKLEKSDPLKAIAYYTELKSHDYFINDYYPYRRLVLMYEKTKQPEEKTDIIKKFLKSGIYCNKHNFLWFKYKLEELKDKGFVTQNEIDSLSEHFTDNSLKNKNLENTPLPIADRIRKKNGKIVVESQEDYDRKQKQYEYEVRCSRLNRQKRYGEYIGLLNYMIDELGYRRYRYFQKLCVAYRRMGDSENEMRIIRRYFNGDSTRSKFSDSWFEKRLGDLENQNNPETEFSLEDADLTKNPLFEYDGSLGESENLKRKAVLIEYGKRLIFESKYNDAILYYKYLCNNSYFSNDWYPYRQLTIIYEKTRDYASNLVNIKKLLHSRIYLNEYQFLWFSEKIRNLMEKTNVEEYEIRKWFEYYEINGALKKSKLNPFLADRFKIDNSTVTVMSDENFENDQKRCALKQRGEIYERVGNFALAISHYTDIIMDMEFNEFYFHQRLCGCFEKIHDYAGEIKAIGLYYTSPPKDANKKSDEWILKRLEKTNEKLGTDYGVGDLKNGI